MIGININETRINMLREHKIPWNMLKLGYFPGYFTNNFKKKLFEKIKIKLTKILQNLEEIEIMSNSLKHIRVHTFFRIGITNSI